MSITADKYKSAQTYELATHHRVFVFELKQQSRNYRHVGNFPTCRQMSCRLDTLADTTFSCVCDVTSDVSRHVARHDTECCHLGTKTTRRHPTYGAKSSFKDRFEDLKAYKEKNGHLYVSWKTDKSLYHWCAKIRCTQKNPEKYVMKLTADRITALDAIGFDWNPVSEK